MSRNGFIGLCVATIIAVALATFSVLRQPTLRSPDAAGDLVFPRLADELNALKTVEVKQADGNLTLDFNGKTWTARDRGGYPADGEKINTLVLQMARLVKVEAKTSAADKFDRLDLGDPTAKNSRAKEIVLLDKDGKTLADLIVGKRKFSLGNKEGGTYVRVAGISSTKPQTWLALGELTPGTKPRDWLKREIVDVKDKDVKRVVVTQPEGDKIVVGKATPADANFKVENLPSGKQQADFGTDDFGRMLSMMMLDDVAKAGDVPFPRDKTVTAEVDSFDGLRINLQMTEKDGGSWIVLKADAVPPAGTKADAPAGPDAGKMAADINARTNGWAYEVPSYEVAALRKKMADLIKKPEPKS